MNNVMTVLAVAALAGTASAQYVTGGQNSAAERVHEHLAEVHEKHVQFTGVEDGKVTVPLSIRDDHSSKMEINSDDTEVSIDQDGSHVIVKIDGIEVFNGELDSDFESFTFVGPDGETEVELVNAGDADHNMFFFAEGEGAHAHALRSFELAQQGQELAKHGRELALVYGDAIGSHPKVMMGVTMESVSEVVAKQLGIDAESATVIGTVMEDLPAGKAGLQQHDIVVGVDGLGSANPKEIREALGDKEPGDLLVLDVLREGRPVQVTLDLEAYDAAALGVTVSRTFSWAPRALDPEHAEEQFGDWLNELIENRAELGEQIKAATDQGTRDELRVKMENVNKHIDKMREQIAKGDFTMPPHMPFGQNAWAWSSDDMGFTLDLDLESMPNVQFAPGVGVGSHAIVVPSPDGNGEMKVLIEKLERSTEVNNQQVEELNVRIMELERMLERAVRELEEAKRDREPDA